ncbi:hypothetical protein GCM10009548_01690 [Streptomyces malaysiensis subsp. malaysiensis]|uniref:Scaffolding protein n=1 Tax=Streptomyces malaysiensis TaxID=92644 RepID=A0ABX6W5S1_STRMQ|nr:MULTISPECIES: hypothetical protein [Streptomyces]QPI56363.1 hypothetical protein I1A49_16690 [Streptomyces solisilvae]UHH17850.1 hypothetical protein LUV23_16805 [Streptomyces sp. HNM0561]
MSTPPEPITPPAGPAVNEHGYPDSTPVAEMEPAHQAAYWKHHARKHEQRANSAPDADELKRLRDRDAALKEREDAELSDAQRREQTTATLTQERDTAKSENATIAAENLRLRVAMDKGLTTAQADRLRGSTKEELEADADELVKLFGGSGQGGNNGGDSGARAGGPRGSDVGDTKTTASGAERYRQRHGKN